MRAQRQQHIIGNNSAEIILCSTDEWFFNRTRSRGKDDDPK